MEIVLTILTGLLFAAGLYLMFQKGMVKLIIGIMMLSYATNLFIFLISRLNRGVPAIINKTENVLSPPFADPIPQALILTAIVIGFGIQAFAIVLIRRVYKVTGTSDMDKLNSSEKID
ncbi:MAG: multicomponent Na+:H+ antiporter subunit [Tenuifilum sp.]|jgi:multicomponent Na+:H+ antiporter subunit C|uniref:Na+/H+ antiporter subunit C n=1 Tax=Tenuifilum sp. TaxID=2760880 RepID=UPI0024AAF401|nr:Na+/H+ antiporter subunit C [Tenuifilum sp.]MDI3526766.1 multicomponent Na+:H+ antiporter subunit [Tenuifilum sp.]